MARVDQVRPAPAAARAARPARRSSGSRTASRAASSTPADSASDSPSACTSRALPLPAPMRAISRSRSRTPPSASRSVAQQARRFAEGLHRIVPRADRVERGQRPQQPVPQHRAPIARPGRVQHLQQVGVAARRDRPRGHQVQVGDRWPRPAACSPRVAHAQLARTCPTCRRRSSRT